MKNILVSLLFAFSAFTAHAGSFSCFTNYAGFIPTGKFRISGTRSNNSLLTINAQYFNNVEYRALPLSINSENNPDKNYDPRDYKGYSRYRLDGTSRGEFYEFFLPNKTNGAFKAYIIARDFEDKSPRYELLCRGQ